MSNIAFPANRPKKTRQAVDIASFPARIFDLDVFRPHGVSPLGQWAGEVAAAGSDFRTKSKPAARATLAGKTNVLTRLSLYTVKPLTIFDYPVV
jgi:hypothetical protein